MPITVSAIVSGSPDYRPGGTRSPSPAVPPPGFHLLGPLGISSGDTLALLHPSKPATLLAMLLTHPNTVVSVNILMRTVWDDEPPLSAKAALHTCVQRLRQLFARYGVPGSDIEAVPGGYRIVARADTLDLLRFRELAGKASAEPDPGAELALLREALALWRGPILSNVNSQLLHREVAPQLAEERLRVLERIFDLEIALDHHREVLPELVAEARANPAHERLWEQLIETLYRTGRRAEALSEYRWLKRHLREELGVDPGVGLQQVELRMLRGEVAGPPARTPAKVESAAASPGRLVSAAQVLDRLQTAGLLRERVDGYEMHELLYVLTRDAAVVDRGPAGTPRPGRLPDGSGPVATPAQNEAIALTFAESGARLTGEDDVV